MMKLSKYGSIVNFNYFIRGTIDCKYKYGIYNRLLLNIL